MSEPRFQLLFSAALLVGTVWYGVQMASYPANAGRVPLIVATVAGAVLLVQIIGQIRALRAPDRGGVPEKASVVGDPSSEDPLKAAEERVHEVDSSLSGYDTLLRLDRVRRRRLFAIVAFSLLFYLGALAVGFVLTTGVLITAFLLVARERIVTALAAGLISAAAVYVLVVLVIGLPALDGYLF